MVRISVAVGSGATCFRAAVRAGSIERALDLARARYPGSEVRILFPIDPEAFFDRGLVPRRRDIWPEMLKEEAG